MDGILIWGVEVAWGEVSARARYKSPAKANPKDTGSEAIQGQWQQLQGEHSRAGLSLVEESKCWIRSERLAWRMG